MAERKERAEARSMVEVVLGQTGDSAVADDPESALVAARTLMRDAYEASRAQGYLSSLTCSFWVDGKVVRVADYQRVCASIR